MIYTPQTAVRFKQVKKYKSTNVMYVMTVKCYSIN